MPDRVIPKPAAQHPMYAAQFRDGEPLDHLYSVAGCDTTARLDAMDERPWLLITWDSDSHCLLVRDRQWLVWPGRGELRVLDDDDFRASYNPASHLGLVSTVASVVGELMITRHSPPAIAEAVLAAIGDYWETCRHEQDQQPAYDPPQECAAPSCERCVRLREAREEREQAQLAHWQAHETASAGQGT